MLRSESRLLNAQNTPDKLKKSTSIVKLPSPDFLPTKKKISDPKKDPIFGASFFVSPKTGFLNNFVCFRKRGGSVDNLLDDLGDVIAPSSMTRESKKKSMSSKNLSLNSTRETSNAKAQQGQGATAAGAAAASGSLAATERITTV